MPFRWAAAVVVVVGLGIAISSRRVCGCYSPGAVAIGALRAINTAQQSYASSCGGGGFAVDLADLAAPPTKGSSGFISPDLDRNGVIKDGYAVALMAGRGADGHDPGLRTASCSGAKHQPVNAYFATAMPVGEPAGRPYFATDAQGVIYQSPRPIANPITPGPDVVVLR
jgi:hypothetical protein